jgi:hypothetical protein
VISLSQPTPGKKDIPVPTAWHHAARAIYAVLLTLLVIAATTTLILAHTPLARAGSSLLVIMPLVLAFMERTITVAAGEKRLHDNEGRRHMAFIAVIMMPMLVIVTLPMMPAMLQVYGFDPSNSSLSLIDSVFMIVIVGGGVFANRRWALNKLQLER